MLHQHSSVKTKILTTILSTIHLALISLGLVSCVIQTPKLPEQVSPQKEQNNPQSREVNNNDDGDDDNNDDNDDDDKDDDDGN
jgi:hypothetical protein